MELSSRVVRGRPNRTSAPLWLIDILMVVALVFAACGSGPSSAPKRGSGSNGPDAAARSVINRFESVIGPPVGSWRVTELETSSVDSTYVLFSVGSTPGHQIQAGYGFAHESSGSWTVIGFGSAEVGCPPGGSDNAVVPRAVLTGFSLTCPTSG